MGGYEWAWKSVGGGSSGWVRMGGHGRASTGRSGNEFGLDEGWHTGIRWMRAWAVWTNDKSLNYSHWANAFSTFRHEEYSCVQ